MQATYFPTGQFIHAHSGVHEPFLIYCGREGFLTSEEFVRRTEADVAAYAEREPFKFRAAMAAACVGWHWGRRKKKTPAACSAPGFPNNTRTITS